MSDIIEPQDAHVDRNASQYARSLIEASLDPLVTISPEGKITDVNEATIKVTGLPRERLEGTDFSDYFTEPERARQANQRVFADGSVREDHGNNVACCPALRASPSWARTRTVG